MITKSLITKENLSGHINLKTPTSDLLALFQIAINGFGFLNHQTTDQFLNFQAGQDSQLALQVLQQFYPQFYFYDLHQLTIKLPFCTKEELYKSYQILNSEKIDKLLAESITWDLAIHEWCFQKKVRPQELLILNNLTPVQRATILSSVSKSELSKSQGLQILEWLSDLILLKVDVPNELMESIDEAKFEKIKELRFPKSFLQHPLQAKKINWGPIQGQFLRKQDKAGFQLQFFVSSSDELSKVIQQLQKNHSDWMS